MKTNLDELIEKITNHPHFLKLKNVVENNGYHDHEDVYSHLLKTARIAREQKEGSFIKNSDAKKLFDSFMNESFGGMIRSDIVVLIALLHDVGKILHHRDGNNVAPLRTLLDDRTTTICPGHEYWGSTIIPEVIKDLSLEDNLIKYIAGVVYQHDTFSPGYFDARKDWSIGILVDDAKSRAEGLYKEALFNVYCDCYTAKPFQLALRKIEEIFNESGLYTPREYFIP